MGVYSRLVEPLGGKPDPKAPDRPEPPSSPGGPTAAELSDSAQQLAGMAERIAAQIRSEAEAAAEQQARQQQVEADRVREFGEISASLTARLEAIQRDAAALLRELDAAMQRLASLGGGLVLAPAPDRPAEATPLEPVAFPGTRAAENGVPKHAALRAAQMAIAGSDRSEIERVLRAEFGIEDPGRILDDPRRA